MRHGLGEKCFKMTYNSCIYSAMAAVGAVFELAIQQKVWGLLLFH